MANIFLYRMRLRRLEPEEIQKMAEGLGIRGRPVQTEEAVVIQATDRVIVYAQPGSRFGGVLFYTDQSESIGQIPERVLETEKAKRWADGFLDNFHLAPRALEDDRVRFRFQTSASTTDAVTFDGKERKRIAVKTDIGSKAALNDVPVVGPRAKVRMIFKGKETPLMIHRGFWDTLDIFQEAELVSENDIARTVRERLDKRRVREAYYDIVGIKLAYFADEYDGGPDLLLPYYFAEVEFADREAEKQGINRGPRQMIRLPAYRSIM